jgi:hypothetical protein
MKRTRLYASVTLLLCTAACGARDPAPTPTVFDPLLKARDSVQPRIEAAEAAHKAALEKAESENPADPDAAR